MNESFNRVIPDIQGLNSSPKAKICYKKWKFWSFVIKRHFVEKLKIDPSLNWSGDSIIKFARLLWRSNIKKRTVQRAWKGKTLITQPNSTMTGVSINHKLKRFLLPELVDSLVLLTKKTKLLFLAALWTAFYFIFWVTYLTVYRALYIALVARPLGSLNGPNSWFSDHLNAPNEDRPRRAI